MNARGIAFLVSLFVSIQNIHGNEADAWINFVAKLQLPVDWIDTCNQYGVLTQTERLVAYVDRPIYHYFYELAEQYPFIECADLPTPITSAEQVSKELGFQLYIKRDDLTGPHDQASRTFGGNKVRKLEPLLGQAKKHNAQEVMTFGCVGSNHAVATAVHAKRAGFHPVCMLKPQPNSSVVRRNLLLHLHNGTELHVFENVVSRSLGALFTWFNRRLQNGVAPYVIPTGGSNPVGVLGFVNAALELKKQIQQGLMPEPDFIYVACGSAGTAAGLLLGCQIAQLKTKIVAVPVMPEGRPGYFFDLITHLAKKTDALLQKLDPRVPYVFDESNLLVDSNFGGEGYGLFTEEGVQAIKAVKERENIQLDGTYSAKAFACLINDAQQGILKGKVVLYWNTFCGLNFDHVLSEAFEELPKSLHCFFTGELQPFER